VLSLSRHRVGAVELVDSPAIGAQANVIRNGNSPLEGGVHAVCGVLRFDTVSELEDYVRALLNVYRKEYDRASDFIGSLYRTTGDRNTLGLATESWEMLGTLIVDSTAPEKGQMDVAIQLLNDLKPRIAKTEEVVNDFEKLEKMPVPVSSTLLLYMRNGAPERLIVDSVGSKEEKYTFREQYELN
jgi:hypothetical protein